MTFFQRIAQALQGYGNCIEHPNVFESISAVFYRENFHSDLLAYYLRHRDAKLKLVEFINSCSHYSHANLHPISFEEYETGAVLREEGDIDITLYDGEGKKAIIIENKSNDAMDMQLQLVRYLNYLENKNVIVERIIYLRKKNLGIPDMSEWFKDDRLRVGTKLISMQLIGQNGFCEQILDRVADGTDDMRLAGLSLEIKALFHSLIYGGLAMDTLGKFVTELRDGTNLETLKKAMDAYRDLTAYWLDFFERYLKQRIESENLIHWRIVRYNSYTVFVDRIPVAGCNVGFDIKCSPESVALVPVIREPGQSDDLIRMRAELGDGKQWPFDSQEIKEGDTYHVITADGQNAACMAIDRIIRFFKNHQDSRHA